MIEASMATAAGTGYEAALARDGAGARWVCARLDAWIVIDPNPPPRAYVQCPVHASFDCVEYQGARGLSGAKESNRDG